MYFVGSCSTVIIFASAVPKKFSDMATSVEDYLFQLPSIFTLATYISRFFLADEKLLDELNY